MDRRTEMVRETYRFCPRCAARVDVGRVPVGVKLTCHQCGLEFPIERESHPRCERAGEGRAGRGEAASDRPRFDDGEGDAAVRQFSRVLQDALVRAPSENASEFVGDSRDFFDMAEEETVRQEDVVPVSLSRLFFSGTFGFPFRPATLVATFCIALGAAVLIVAARTAAWCAWMDGDAVATPTRALLWSGLSMSLAWGGVLAVGWYYLTSAYAATILTETACGVDCIEDWPRLLAPEWHSGCAYVGIALTLSVLPLVAVETMLGGRPATDGAVPWLSSFGPHLLLHGGDAAVGEFARLACVLLLFPPILLSMLESRSPLNPLSLSVWRSIFCRCRVWAVFYALTLAAAAIVWAAWRWGAVEPTRFPLGEGRGAVPLATWTLRVVAEGTIASAAIFVYFRLLGRLAWFCAGRKIS